MKKIDTNMVLLLVMMAAYAMAIGATINGVFAVVLSGEDRGQPLRIFIIGICFALAGTLFRGAIKRRSATKK